MAGRGNHNHLFNCREKLQEIEPETEKTEEDEELWGSAVNSYLGGRQRAEERRRATDEADQ